MPAAATLFTHLRTPSPGAAGLRGTIPNSLGGLPRLWRLNIVGTSMRCNDTTQQPPPCPVPGWLEQQRHQYYYDRTGLECPVLTFVQPRSDVEQMSKIYRGAPEPEVGLACTDSSIFAYESRPVAFYMLRPAWYRVRLACTSNRAGCEQCNCVLLVMQ
jgi:hypothetical protein